MNATFHISAHGGGSKERNRMPGSMLMDMITMLTTLAMIAFLWLR